MRWHRAVGYHQVQALDGQVGQQPLKFVFAAVDAQHFIQLHGRCQQAVDDGFGHHVGHPHAEQDLLLRACAQHGFQLAANLEHLLCIYQRLAAGLGQLQLPAGALEQFKAVGLLEQADLPADGLRCKVQLFAGAGNAARLGHGPEVMQLAIVKHRRSSRFVKTEVYAMKIRIFLNYQRL
ncbi:hypothetical protein D3C80_1440470 [compost metagenome]